MSLPTVLKIKIKDLNGLLSISSKSNKHVENNKVQTGLQIFPPAGRRQTLNIFHKSDAT